jgi:hypothetical protein
MFCAGKIKDGDYFLYTDAWNPTVIQLKYMAELLKVKIKIGGLWHAGSYDSHDFLGRLIGDKPWVRNAELSMFNCYDHNFFATDFHIKMWNKVFANMTYNMKPNKKVVQTGWPMEYASNELEPYKGMKKKNIVIFPHRIAPEKQPEIFYDLKEALPQYDFVVCQERSLKKYEYHNLLAESKLVFSANLQETLGISGYEGLILDCMVMVPDRLSYTEMFIDTMKYPDVWTKNMENYQGYKPYIIERIVDIMENYPKYLTEIHRQKKKLQTEFFHGKNLYEAIQESII